MELGWIEVISPFTVRYFSHSVLNTVIISNLIVAVLSLSCLLKHRGNRQNAEIGVSFISSKLCNELYGSFIGIAKAGRRPSRA